MPWTPWRSTSSATRNASTIEVPFSRIVSSRLFGTTISVSTSSRQRLDADVAASARRVPSKPNGFVTIADRQRADLARDARDDRRRAGAGAAARAGGDEDHVAALQQRLDLVVLLHRRCAAEVRVGARAEPARDALADVQRDVRGRLLQRLQVGVDRDELDALDLGLDHPVDGVDAGAADADDAQDRRAGDARACAAS